MAAFGKGSAIALSVTLLVGGSATPSVAAQVLRSNDPSVVTASELTPIQTLRTSVAQARAAYAVAVNNAKAQRRDALVAPKSDLAASLAVATTKADKRLARRAYARAIQPIQADYDTAVQAATATRDAAIDEALAAYLAATGKTSVAAALSTYRTATATARATLELALQTSRETYRTDTADERARLVADLEVAETRADSLEAWQDFVAGCADEGQAHAAAIAAARTTYKSALAQARAEFRATTGVRIQTLLKLPFKI